jgi:hypothetical protein
MEIRRKKLPEKREKQKLISVEKHHELLQKEIV